MAVSAEIPEGLKKEMDKEVERGHYTSQSELIRDAIRRLIEQKHTVDESLSKETIKEIREAREQESKEDVRKLIEDRI